MALMWRAAAPIGSSSSTLPNLIFLQPCDLGALLRMREEAGALLKAIASPSWQQLLSSAQHLCPTQAAKCAETCDGCQEV